MSKFMDEECPQFRIPHISTEDNCSFSRKASLIRAVVPNVKIPETCLALSWECTDSVAQKDLVVRADVGVVDDREEGIGREWGGRMALKTCTTTVLCYACSKNHECNGEEDSSPLRMSAHERVRSLWFHVQKGKGCII